MIKSTQMLYSVSIVLLLLGISLADAQEATCLESNTHKPHPTQESELFGECKSWSEMACCNSTSTEQIHQSETPWNGFNYNHCGRISYDCKLRMTQEVCMYECDPYLKNWIVADKSKKMRSERYYKIPLCRKDCDNWFNACKNDFTCRDNWSYGFLWRGGVNYCRPEDKCITIKEMFGTADNFCKLIWDDSFVIEEDTNKCFTFDFKGTNPNKAAAKYYAKK